MMRSTPRLSAYRHGAALERLARSFLPDFPELDALDFDLDLLPSSSWLLGVTEDGAGRPRVRLRAARPVNPSLTYTIPHEFAHLLQRPLRLAPQGERAADLYAMARAGDRFLVPPGYVRVPSHARLDWGLWSSSAASLAKEALMRRAWGERVYIRWWEDAFRDRVGRTRPTGPPADAGGGSRTP